MMAHWPRGGRRENGYVALKGSRAASEDCVVDEELRVWNGCREHDGMSVRWPVDLTGY